MKKYIIGGIIVIFSVLILTSSVEKVIPYTYFGADSALTKYYNSTDTATIGIKLTNFIFNATCNITLGNGGFNLTIDSDTIKGNPIWDGQLTTTPVYNDISIAGTSFGAGAKAPSLMTFVGGIERYGFNYQTQDDEVSFEVQLNHMWIENDTAHFHIHFAPETTPVAGDTVVIGFEYAFATIDSVMSSPNYHTSDTVTVKMPINGMVANQHKRYEIVDIPLPACKVSTIIICRLFRAQSSGSDTYQHFVFIYFADFHYKVNGFGSTTEWVK